MRRRRKRRRRKEAARGLAAPKPEAGKRSHQQASEDTRSHGRRVSPFSAKKPTNNCLPQDASSLDGPAATTLVLAGGSVVCCGVGGTLQQLTGNRPPGQGRAVRQVASCCRARSYLDIRGGGCSLNKLAIVVCLQTVMLLSVVLQTTFCENLRQHQMKPGKLAAMSEKKSTVIRLDQWQTEANNGVQQPEQRRLKQRKQPAQYETPFISGAAFGSDDYGIDYLAKNRLVVVGGDSAELGCHLLGEPLELAGAWPQHKWTLAKTGNADRGPHGASNNGTGNDGEQAVDDDENLSSASGGSGLVSGFDPPDQSDYLNENDLVSLIFWYKDDDPTPIYTLDARQVALNLVPYNRGNKEQPAATRWSTGTANTSGDPDDHRRLQHRAQEDSIRRHSVQLLSGDHQRLVQNNRQLLAEAKHYPSSKARFGSRLRLDLYSQFPIIKLLVENTSGQDSGQYKCRVDFRRSRTVSQFVGLLVEVPLSGLEISIGRPGYERTGGSESPGQLKTDDQPAAASDADYDPAAATSGRQDSSRLEDPVEAVFSENQEAQFTCLAFDASPAPTISWLVRWPPTGAANGSGNSPEPPTEQLLVEGATFASRGSARLTASPMTREQVSGAVLATGTSAARHPTEEPASVVGSRLVVAPMTSDLHGARVGCRASQQVTLVGGSANNRPSARDQRKPDGFRKTPPSGQSRVQISANYKSGSKMIDVQANVTSSAKADTITNNTVGANNEPPAQNLQLTKWFQLKLRLSPKKIEILSEQARPEVGGGRQRNRWLAELDEGQSAKFLCSSRGSQPAAKLRWSWAEPSSAAAAGLRRPPTGRLDDGDGYPKTQEPRALTAEGEASSSLFEISPVSWRHHLAQLVCVATNEELEQTGGGSSLRATIKLLVKFKPSVRIVELPEGASNEPLLARPTAVTSRQLDQAKSGFRRILKCSVQSNPPINQLVWLVNEQPLARVTPPDEPARAGARVASRGRPRSGPKSPASAGLLTAASAPTTANSRLAERPDRPESIGPLRPASSSSSMEDGEITAAGAAVASPGDIDDIDEDEDDNNNSSNNKAAAGRMEFGGNNGRAKAEATNNSDTIKGYSSDNNNELDNWIMSPLVPSAIDGSKYVVEGDLLNIINLTKFDQKDEYKCLATNSLGQGASKKFQLSVNYKPLCLTTSEKGKQDTSGPANGLKSSLDPPSPLGLDATLGLGLEADQVWQVDNSAAGSVRCQVEAKPAPSRFAWSFVALDELVKFAQVRRKRKQQQRRNSPEGDMLEEGRAGDDDNDADDDDDNVGKPAVSLLNQSTSLWIETESDELSHKELFARLAMDPEGRQQHGLLLCKALNPVGWQARPCVNLVLTPELLEPSAGNCSVEPLIERLPGDANNMSSSNEHIAISVDCSRVQNKERLLFQLAITRRDAQDARWPELGPPTSSASSQATTWRNKRLLFTEVGGRPKSSVGGKLDQSTRIPVSDLLADLQEQPAAGSQPEQPEAEVQRDQQHQQQQQPIGSEEDELLASGEQRKSRRGQAGGLQQDQGRIMTLGEQVELLNELVFSISASNLMRTSEPHAILGSQLRLPEVAGQQPDGRPLAGQVSRSASNADSLTDEPGQQQSAQQQAAVNLPASSNGLQTLPVASQQPLGAGARRPGAPPGRGQQADSAAGQPTWSQHLEANIILVAIGGTAVLSALTLTLIILVLRGRTIGSSKRPHNGGPPNRGCFRRNSKTGNDTKCSQSMVHSGQCNELPLSSRPASAGSTTKKPGFLARANCHLESPSSRPASCRHKLPQASGVGVNFLAPPVCHSSLGRTGGSGRAMLLSVQPATIERGAHLAAPSHLSLAEHLGESETLYVIGGAANTSADLEREINSALDLSGLRDDLACGAAGCGDHHLCEPPSADHCLIAAGGGGQQPLSYCSPSICNSSMSHQESLATLTTTPTTSDHCKLLAGGSPNLGASTCQFVDIVSNKSIRQQDDDDEQNDPHARGALCTTNASPSRATVCSNVNSMYLFSFL